MTAMIATIALMFVGVLLFLIYVSLPSFIADDPLLSNMFLMLPFITLALSFVVAFRK